jgi:hypothetical protein
LRFNWFLGGQLRGFCRRTDDLSIPADPARVISTAG